MNIRENLTNMQATQLRAILLGESLRWSGRLIVASLAVMGLLSVLLTQTGALGEAINRWVGTNYNLMFVLLILTGIGMGTSFYNNGIILSIVVVAIPLAAILSQNIMFAGEPTRFSRIGYTVQGMALYGAPFGMLGFVLGRGVNQLMG